MSQPIIEIQGVGKRYRIGATKEPYLSLRDEVAKWFSPAARRARAAEEEFWALRDVTFSVEPGEAVGIIGRNGAGKSTLLKILSQITPPTEGKITMRGRVGSLLEVGTGFHPELTGRENIYMNGAILGMSRREIARKFDEIVAFAEMEKFLDTPVKRYSSGMYVRLAFAVAAHLEPEILVIDEVLAVGDAEFQKKCLGKMDEVAKQGRTVLFVSHNMAAIRGLCGQGLLLKDGRLLKKDTVSTIVQEYLSTTVPSSPDYKTLNYRHRGTAVAIDRVDLVVNGVPTNSVSAGDMCIFRVHYHSLSQETLQFPFSVSIMLFIDGQKIANLWTNYENHPISIQPTGVVECMLPRWPFRGRNVRVDVYTHIGPEPQDWIEESLNIYSHDGDYYGTGVMTSSDQGILLLEHSWSSYANK
jgi:lipopolysaccharide transport system ATP-binding protein